MKSPPGNFRQRVPIMNPIGSCSARSKYHLTIKKPRMYGRPDFGGLAA